MKFQPINPDLERPDVLQAKYRYGTWFGLFLGFGFALFTWGIDAYVLSLHNGLEPWIKFLIGAVLFMVVGGITGWLSARAGKSIYSVLLWLAAGSVFALLMVYLPLGLLPKVLVIIEPQMDGLLQYTYHEGFGARVGVAYAWLSIFIMMAGLLQIPMSDSAVFSTSFFGKLGPILVVVVLMGIAGTIVDNGLVNKSMRDAVVSIDNTIQFVLDHRGKEVNLAEARRMHTSAFSAIDASVTQERKIIVSSYDQEFGEVNVLVIFERDWVECKVFYNQPIFCTSLDISP